MNTESTGSVDWTRVVADLRAYRAARQQVWGDLDEAALGRYAVGVATPDEVDHVQTALAQYSDLRWLVALVREVTGGSDSDEDPAAGRGSDALETGMGSSVVEGRTPAHPLPPTADEGPQGRTRYMLHFGCPHCRVSLKVAPEAIGQRTRCPHCKSAIAVPVFQGELIPADCPDDHPECIVDEPPARLPAVVRPAAAAFYPVDILELEWEQERNQNRRALFIASASATSLLAVVVGLIVWYNSPEHYRPPGSDVASRQTGPDKPYPDLPVLPPPLPPSPPKVPSPVPQPPASGRVALDPIARPPDPAEEFNNKGLAAASKGYHDEAIDHYDSAIKINPNFAAAYVNRAVSRYQKRDPDTALADLGRALQINPHHAEAYNHRAVLYSSIGRFDEAIQDLTRSLDLGPSAPVFYARGLVYLERGRKKTGQFSRDGSDFRSAIQDFTHAIQMDSKHALAYCQRGLVYQAMKEYPTALTNLTEAIKIDPKCFPAYYHRGSVYLTVQNPDNALRDFSKAGELEPKSAHSYVGMGLAYLAKRNREEALAHFRKAKQLDPSLHIPGVSIGQ